MRIICIMNENNDTYICYDYYYYYYYYYDSLSNRQKTAASYWEDLNENEKTRLHVLLNNPIEVSYNLFCA
jgi:hypothetical protein